MDGIPEAAMMFVKQARKYADPLTFNDAEAFDLLFSAIEPFNGAHSRCAGTRRALFEAINVALSTLPGNNLSVRCVQLGLGSYAIQWLPYVKSVTAGSANMRQKH